jgi:anti-sigma factor RsiW
MSVGVEMKELTANSCDHAEDLVAFLYGELSDIEARRFERHMRECATCESEYASFGMVRQSVIDWRNESLCAWSPASLQPALSLQRANNKRSAFAALREFFSLSPLWLKGVTAFASLLFCVCATLAVLYVTRDRTPVIVQGPAAVATNSSNEAQLLAQIAELRKQNDVLQTKAQTEKGTGSTTTKASNPKVATQSEFARNARRPLTRQERMELAADLRLLSAREDEDFDSGDNDNHPY